MLEQPQRLQYGNLATMLMILPPTWEEQGEHVPEYFDCCDEELAAVASCRVTALCTTVVGMPSELMLQVRAAACN
jgi:hypothetical protein